MAKVGVVLSGCGFLDGSEIHEAVLTLLALDKAGAEVLAMAPNVDQAHVIDHLAGRPAEGERRNVLVESARIARGKIADIASVKASDIDALMFPGGYGAAKNLSTFAFDGENAKVNPDVSRLVRDVHQAGKWIAAVCIAPAMIAKVLQEAGVKDAQLTIGVDPATAGKIQAMGAIHVECPVKEARVDEKNKIITSPAYMYDARISDVAAGIEQAASWLLAAIKGEPVGKA
jgi:enhancing lycopene biosynthesis protein 2